MQGYVLHRFNGQSTIILGAYTSLALAEAARASKIQNYIDAQNAQRDVDYNAGASFGQVLAPADVLDLVFITQVTVDQ